MSLLRLAMIMLSVAGAAAAEPLAEMDGTWRGSGWARETPQGPQETVRCQLRNAYDGDTTTLTLTGQCIVPGRRLTISGTLTADNDSKRITGRWSNPDGVGSVQIVGIQRDGIVAFNFSATDPVTGHDLAQNVEWSVSDAALRLRSTDRSNPDILMSDISFSQ
jgi:hypothetical protein